LRRAFGAAARREVRAPVETALRARAPVVFRRLTPAPDVRETAVRLTAFGRREVFFAPAPDERPPFAVFRVVERRPFAARVRVAGRRLAGDGF
jgi:hypothetical protein